MSLSNLFAVWVKRSYADLVIWLLNFGLGRLAEIYQQSFNLDPEFVELLGELVNGGHSSSLGFAGKVCL